MMRDIKFRGISKRTGDFVFGYFLICRGKNGNYAAIKDTPSNINNSMIDLIPTAIEPGTEGQCIGLRDNSGVEIYEGDVLQTFIHPEIPIRHVVEWSDKYFGWYMRHVEDKSGSIMAFVYFNNTGENCEVIGNIHENPEFLEQV